MTTVVSEWSYGIIHTLSPNMKTVKMKQSFVSLIRGNIAGLTNCSQKEQKCQVLEKTGERFFCGTRPGVK